MKLRLLAVAVGAAISFSASAAPIFSLNTFAGWDGSFAIKLTGYEAFTGPIAPGSENFGVLDITTILDNNNNTMWQKGQDGAEITGVFSNILITSATDIGPGSIVLATGGIASFFINPIGSLNSATGIFTPGQTGFQQGLGGYANAGCAPNTVCYNGISNVVGGGSLFDAAWTPGTEDAGGDTTTTVSGFFADNPQLNVAAGFLNVTGGTYAAMFDTNGFTFNTPGNTPADLSSINSFCVPGANGCAATVADAGGLPAAGGWALQVQDPVTGSIAVPEPGSLALIGVALVALATSRRRKV